MVQGVKDDQQSFHQVLKAPFLRLELAILGLFLIQSRCFCAAGNRVIEQSLAFEGHMAETCSLRIEREAFSTCEDRTVSERASFCATIFSVGGTGKS